MRVLLICALITIPQLLPAQQASPVAIFVSEAENHAGYDGVGTRLVYEIRERIRKSAGMELAPDRSTNGFRLIINHLTADDANSGTVYSIVLTLQHNQMLIAPFEIFLDNIVGRCPARQVEECAAEVLAMIDKDLTAIREATRPKP